MRSIRTCGITATMVALLLPGCSRDPGRPEDATPEPGAQPVWLAPEQGEVVADSIRTSIRFAQEGVVAATLVTGGEPVGTRDRPPWEFVYLPPLDSSRRIRLRVVFETDAGCRESDERWVFWVPNQPPRIQWVPQDPPLLYERAAGESLRVSAVDPEDGPLGSRAVTWWSDRQGLVGVGPAVPAGALLSGRHRIEVQAIDRWGRRAAAAREIEVFPRLDPSTPEGAVTAIRFALAAGRLEEYAAGLDPEFRFRFCAADRSQAPDLPSFWSRSEEIGFAGKVHSGPLNRLFRLSWRAGPSRELQRGEERWALVELAELDLGVQVDHHPPLEVRGGRARLYLRFAVEDGLWRVVEWIDLGGGTGTTQGLVRWRVGPRSSSRGSWRTGSGQSLYM
ncbi:MAG: hypothetical protein GF346_00830 [Candidatus Eisenbacteria bacterium]|nr:hypothetical protein [Candidatus Latescibacterota bacterium]MBD3300976.1 hypothetical protein [Candidatus Eisenbacteria bacterium]